MPEGDLRALAASLRSGVLALGNSCYIIKQVGGVNAGEVQACLDRLAAEGLNAKQAALFVDAIADGRKCHVDPARILELVLSGPEVAGIPTSDTGAVLHAMFTRAERQVLLAGYAVYQGHRVFEYLARRMHDNPLLQVKLCLDIRRPWEDNTPSDLIVKRFYNEFIAKHWPWERQPELYYDPRSLDTNPEKRSSMHAKCVIVDEAEVFVTSANFTEAAQERNIEAGVLLRHPPLAHRLSSYFEQLIATQQLRSCG